MKTPRCRSCDAPIRWARKGGGKWMPLDHDPNEVGNVWLLSGRFFPDGAQVIAHVGKDATPPLDLDPTAVGPYMPHFATCPRAGEHRKPMRTGGRMMHDGVEVWL